MSSGKVRELFEEIVDSPLANRRELTERLCGENAELKSEVAQLLSAFQQADGILDSPAGRAGLHHDQIRRMFR